MMVRAQEAATDDPIVLKLDFDDEDIASYASDSGELELMKLPVAPSGEFVLKATGDDYCDVEKYINYTDTNTKIAFHYFNHGITYLRVLGGSTEDGENLYYDVKPFTGNEEKWDSCIVKLAELKNLIPRHNPDPATAVYGDISALGKTMRNIVFHIKSFKKDVKDPYALFDDITIYNGDDKVAPSAPANVKVETKDNKTLLTWTRATDNIGVSHYLVMAGGKEVGKSVLPQFDLTGKDVKAAYTVIAVDWEGNKSK